MKISVVVNSLNEGEKLRRCLESLEGLASEIIVLDMESVDNTKEVAYEFDAKIIEHKRLDYIEPVRQLGVLKTSNEWVLVLDPDERIGSKLKEKLKKIAEEDKVLAVNIPRLNYIFGKKIKHTNFWPDRQIRFFKKSNIKFSDEIHSYPQVLGERLDLEAKEELAIKHYPYQNITEYLARMKRYSDIESRNMYKSGKRFSVIRLIYAPLYDFLRRYIRHLGFLDGWVGLLLSLLQAYYYIVLEIKLARIDK